MGKRKYEEIEWYEIDSSIRRKYSDWIKPCSNEGKTLEGFKDEDLVQTYCKICKAVVSKPMLYKHWRQILTADDQAHLYSKQHKAGMLLQKLSGGEA